jgi:primosomal protein N' (replication factor Y) (superfamily II helicase)
MLDIARLSPQVTPRMIDGLLDESPVVTQAQIDLCRFVSEYYFAALGEVIRLCLPANTPRNLPKNFNADKKKKSRKSKTELILEHTASTHLELTNSQKNVIATILSSCQDSSAFLLQGVTGSGKTEIYIAASRAAIKENKSVMIVVPEIALTPQLVNRFAAQLQAPIAVLHSGLSKAERSKTLVKLLKNEARIAIGARSVLFAPMPNLGLIIVDEEHDQSLKQDGTPRYHGRDVALWRAKHENSKIILGSATPSLESLLNVEKGKLRFLSLPERIGANGQMPQVEIVDLKLRSQNQNSRKKDRATSGGQRLCILSGPLKEAMALTLQGGEQIMLFLNRRGYAAFALCKSCGHIMQCFRCSTSLTYHQKSNLLRCHQCDLVRSACDICPSCKEGRLIYLGLGTERVEREVALCFPNAKIARLDRDMAHNHSNVKSILANMHAGKIDVLIGTQMIAKGHDFKGVSLVGVILADTALAMPDFRASERAFQLLTQVAGRAGRGDCLGRVIIQTFNPEHPAIRFAKSHDVKRFTKQESESRKISEQPPYVRAALLRVESLTDQDSEKISRELKRLLQQQIELHSQLRSCSALGPAPAPIARLRGKSRWHLYLRAPSVEARTHLLKTIKQCEVIQKEIKRSGSKLVIDVDPVLLM